MLPKYHVPWIGAFIFSSPKRDFWNLKTRRDDPILPRLHAELVDHKSERMIPKEKSPWSKARYSLGNAGFCTKPHKKRNKGTYRIVDLHVPNRIKHCHETLGICLGGISKPLLRDMLLDCIASSQITTHCISISF